MSNLTHGPKPHSQNAEERSIFVRKISLLRIHRTHGPSQLKTASPDRKLSITRLRSHFYACIIITNLTLATNLCHWLHKLFYTNFCLDSEIRPDSIPLLATRGQVQKQFFVILKLTVTARTPNFLL